MKKNITSLTIKTIFALGLLDQSASALTLNGNYVNFDKKKKILDKKSRALTSGYKTIIAKFDTPLSESRKSDFYESGVSTIVYAGDLSYYFYAKRSVLNSLDFENSDFVAKVDMESKYRVNQEDKSLVTLGHGDLREYNILFLTEFTQSDVEEYFAQNDIEANILKVIPQLREVKVEICYANMEKLKKLHLVQYMDRVQTMVTVSGKTSRNKTTAKNSNVSVLWGDEYKLNGENVDIGIVDGGVIRSSHQEFNNGGESRVFNRSNTDTNFHATHVGGTIIADGDKNDARGMANRANLYSYGFNDVSFADSFLELYKNDGVLLSNHSYGYSDKSQLGSYDTTAATQDRAVQNNPFLNVFEAAGNDGEDSSYGNFGIIKGPGNSKNIFTIGALNNNSTGVADISSTGPVKDGRIKPDLCIRGEYITSTTNESDSDYATMTGTSMASPAATGIAALITQQYKRVTGGFDIRHDLLKSVMVNTAVDKENKGPDYKVGFGMIDAKASVDVIKSIDSASPLATLGLIEQGGQKIYEFSISKNQKFKTTISWVDKSANPASAVTLVNDIDMVLIDKNTGKKYYPYTLDKNRPNALAVTNKANRVDNIEQIEVANLKVGSYKLVVSGSKIISSSAEFAIASNSDIFESSTIQTLQPSQLKCFAKVMHRSIL